MRNLRLRIQYDGTNYCGWQVQGRNERKRSIQGVLERTLRKILQEKIKLIASGRTDAGVHALAQAANFKTSSSIPLYKLKAALNAILPLDIAVAGVEEAPKDFHARFDAKSKVYRYIILNSPHRSALLKDRAYFYPYPLDIKSMRRASRCLLGQHDFKAFCASGSSAKDTVRTIKRITVKKLPYPLYAIRSALKESPLIIIDIEADGFLYNMVRGITGTLIQIGRGKFPADNLRKALLSADRRFVGPTVPACGLYLLEVKY